MNLHLDFLTRTHLLCKPVARVKLKNIAHAIELNNLFRTMQKADVAAILHRGGTIKGAEIWRTRKPLDDEGDYQTVFMAHNYLINYCHGTGRAEILEFIE